MHQQATEWLPSIGAIAHMTPNLQLLESLELNDYPTQVLIGNGNFLYLCGILIVPQLTTNLISVGKFVSNN